MSKSRANQVKGRVSRGRRVYIGAVSRLIGKSIREQKRTRLTPYYLRVLDRAIAPKRPKTTPLTPETRSQIANVLKLTAYWHGTGRYQYRDGKVVDVLEYIAGHHELQPGPDPFDILGDMHSLSMARARIYARAYADLHRDAALPAERYGSSAFWAVVFLSDYVLEAAREEGSLRRVIKRLEQSGKDEWHGKVNRQPLSVFSSFAAGSDIPGNYPILFGIHNATSLPTSRAIAIHEVRSGSPVDLGAQVTYLEVPRANMPETEAVLRQYGVNIPVYALEEFERYASDFSVSDLMRPRSSRQ